MLKETIGDGFTWASCPAEVAEQTHTVVTMLPNNDIVKVSQGRAKGHELWGFLHIFRGKIFKRDCKQVGKGMLLFLAKIVA